MTESTGYIIIKRPPRIIKQLPTSEGGVEIPAAASSRLAKGFLQGLRGVLNIGGMALTGLGFALVSLLTGQMLFAVISIIAPIFVLAGSYLDWKIRKKTEQEEQENYLEKLKLKQKQLEELRFEQQQILGQRDCSPEQLLWMVLRQEERNWLWERSTSDSDFLSVRLGIGNRFSSVKVRGPNPDNNVPFLDQALKLTRAYQVVPDVPGLVCLQDVGSIGITGAEEYVSDFVRAFLVNLTGHHSPLDVSLRAVYPEELAETWFWLGWLPHTQSPNEGVRPLVAATQKEADKLVDDLLEEITSRENQKASSNYGNLKPNAAQWNTSIVFVVDIRHFCSAGLRLTGLSGRALQCGIHLIFIANEVTDIPNNCGAVIYLNPKGSLSYRLAGEKGGATEWRPDLISLEQADIYAREMSPFRLNTVMGNMSFPTSIRLFDMYNFTTRDSVRHFIEKNWLQPSGNQLAAPVGKKVGGRLQLLNIADGSKIDNAHGPHGLVAGTTGSGKSELLLTLITSLAIQNHPYYLNFVLVDFKGGAAFKMFKSLPHTSGFITDLEGKLAERALVSLESELTRRKYLFNQANVEHIEEYHQKQRRGQVPPVPYLLLVVDEFAQLVQQAGDFVEKLVGIARIGRTLGVHLLLATQNPRGVVNKNILDNTNYKICLRVLEDEVSTEIIGRKDAARIPLSARGRAFLKVGSDFDQFQSARVMVEHSTDAASKAAVRDRIITRIDEFWLQNEIYGPKRTEEVVAQNQDSLKDVDIAVAACTDIALKHNIRPDTLPAPWLEPLPVELYLEQLLGKKCFQPDTGWPEESPFGLLAAPIGLEDIPTQQAQPELLINLAQTGNNQPGNLMIVGVNGSERSSLLRTAILSLSLTHSPAIIEFSMIDYGNQSLKPFQKLPHRTTVLCRGDEVSLSESFRKIVGEIKERNSLFARLRVDNWVSYWSRQDNTSNPRKAIVLVVDNYTSMKSQSDFNDEDFHYIIREGPAYGIFVVVTADRSNDVNYGRLDAQFQILCLSMAKDHLAFSMDDPTYKSWKAVPGRGFRDGKAISRAIEFQAAQPLPASSEKQLDCLLEKVEELANFKGN